MPSDFRYNTGETRVPWAAVGENYNVHDLMEIIRFLMEGEGKEYDEALENVWKEIKKLDKISTPPGKLSLGSKVEAAEKACNEYLGTDTSTFVTNCTAGFEIAYKYAGLNPGDEVIVPAITFVATMAYPLSIGSKACLRRHRSRNRKHGSGGRGKKDHSENKNDRPCPYRGLSR